MAINTELRGCARYLSFFARLLPPEETKTLNPDDARHKRAREICDTAEFLDFGCNASWYVSHLQKMVGASIADILSEPQWHRKLPDLDSIPEKTVCQGDETLSKSGKNLEYALSWGQVKSEGLLLDSHRFNSFTAIWDPSTNQLISARYYRYSWQERAGIRGQVTTQPYVDYLFQDGRLVSVDKKAK